LRGKHDRFLDLRRAHGSPLWKRGDGGGSYGGPPSDRLPRIPPGPPFSKGGRTPPGLRGLRESSHVPLLHPSADLRLGHRHHHHHRRAGGVPGAAHRPVSPDRAAHGADHRHLSRRFRRDPGAHRGRPHRGAVERRRGHGLFQFLRFRQRFGDHHRHLRGGHRRGPGLGQRQQPGEGGGAAPARRSAAQRRHRAEAFQRLPPGHRHGDPGQALRHPVPVQLRQPEHRRRTEAPERRGRRHRLRRPGLRHAHLAEAGPHGPAGSHHQRHRRRHPRPERPERGGQDRPGAGPGRPDAGLHRDRQGAAADAGTVRRHRHPRRRAGRRAAPARRGPRRAGRQQLRAERHPGRQPHHRHGRVPPDRRQRPGNRRAGQRQDGGVEEEIPPGRGLRHPLRHHPLRQRLHPRGGAHPGRGHPAGAGRGLPVPAKLARHPDPHGGGARVPDRHLRRPVAVRLLHQHPDPVRPGAGHRHRGGRRHRRAGERGAPHGREGPQALRRRRGGHEGSVKGR
jgi:hypothetical protein